MFCWSQRGAERIRSRAGAQSGCAQARNRGVCRRARSGTGQGRQPVSAHQGVFPPARFGRPVWTGPGEAKRWRIRIYVHEMFLTRPRGYVLIPTKSRSHPKTRGDRHHGRHGQFSQRGGGRGSAQKPESEPAQHGRFRHRPPGLLGSGAGTCESQAGRRPCGEGARSIGPAAWLAGAAPGCAGKHGRTPGRFALGGHRRCRSWSAPPVAAGRRKSALAQIFCEAGSRAP